MIIPPHKLREYRMRAGVAQADLARAAGMSQAAISKIEKGMVDPKFSTMEKISRVLLVGSGKTAGSMANRRLVWAKPESKKSSLRRKMKKHGISQIPVISNGIQIGCVFEMDLLKDGKTAKEIMSPPLAEIPAEFPEYGIRNMLKSQQAVIVKKNGRIYGIVTKSDII